MEAPNEWESYVVHSNGANLQCYRTGDGPPIVLVHAWSDSSFRWVPLVDDLADDYEVVAYDARAHGRSDAPETGYSLSDRIADLRTVIRESGLTKPVLIGHSMGTGTVARTAVRHPGLCRGVVLEEPDGLHAVPDDGPDERVAQIRDAIQPPEASNIGEITAEYYQDFDPEQAQRLGAASVNLRPEAAEMVRDGYPSPLSEIFPELTCRTLILRRDVDIETRVKDLDAADVLPDGRLVHIHDASHYVFDDEYDAAYAELQAFLRRV